MAVYCTSWTFYGAVEELPMRDWAFSLSTLGLFHAAARHAADQADSAHQ